MVSTVVLLAYFGPETVLPMTSVIATAVGLFMMFGRNTLRFLFRWRRVDLTAPKTAEAVRGPHFSPNRKEQPVQPRR
ncbi:hypothetical protein SAMN05444166_7476 [Singulisphaera sp. GP187]|uniref:hypothetical protein n=1 Tax=Singulisphaera sp. GP187 TaxID=1882752 RepID=UPI000927DC79|nr:hypothetical protein [Singulisphaera sp. GP187]SIO64905.1 hypothetical protein SAMN05444166_7476 [Singulisphaera sp. GP187]